MAIIIVASISLATVYVLLVNRLKVDILERQEETARQIMTAIDKTLHGAQKDIQVIAELSEVSTMIKGSEIDNLKMNLEKYQSSIGTWSALAIVDASGEVLASTKSSLSSSSREALNTIKEVGLYSSDLVSSSNNEKSIIFAIPVYDSSTQQKYIGAIVGEFPWIIIEELLYEYDEDILKLVDSSHTVLASNNYDKELENAPLLKVEAEQHGHFQYKGNDWEVELSNSESQLLGGVRYLLAEIFGIIILVAVSIGVVSRLFLSKYIIEPIELLSEASRMMSVGDYQGEVQIDQHNEIGQLAKTFNSMTKSINSSQRQLEAKVAERTSELKAAKENLETKIALRTKEIESDKGDLEGEVQHRTLELESKLRDLEKLNDLMVKRELTMVELKGKLQAEKGSKK